MPSSLELSPQRNMDPTDRPKILFAATSLEPGTGGIQRVARLMARVLLDDFADCASVSLLTLHDKASAADIPAPVRFHGGSSLRMAYNAIRNRGSHLITDACNLGQLHWLPGLRRKPYLTALHGIEIWETAKKRWVRSAKAATMQMFVSDYSRRRAESIHGSFPQSRVCWLATETDELPPARPYATDANDVIIVGRMFAERYKGHHELIAAWPAVISMVPRATLRIIGRGPGEGALKALAERSGAAKNIVFEGFVSEQRLDELYARAALYAMPSRGEGFGLVYIEAMRHGLPVIASRHDAAPEVVIDGVTGYTVDLDSPGQLQDRIIRLLQNRELAARLGEAGRRRWAEHFRYSCFRARYGEILSSFLQTRAIV
ncbi:MAG TPA: glycosyltransferase family 4 protein [Gemmata sp.]|jgi:phosphatidylinositol alpha-1,6-mannosyltransferase|nr:glycosyltransferase family 4 protein [Gemmata sp.]